MYVIPRHDRPCASEGLISYRYRSQDGWVLVGATSRQEALREAYRSIAPAIPDEGLLEVWNGSEWVQSMAI